MAWIPAFHFTSRIVGTFLRLNTVESMVHGYVPTNVIKDKKLKLGTKVGGIPESGGVQVRLGFFRC